MMKYAILLLAFTYGMGYVAAAEEAAPAKTQSVFFSDDVLAQARRNMEHFPWAASHREQAVQAAARWAAHTDEELWELMFCPGLPRSWMVWSDGFCPACRNSVPMYTWECDPAQHPWKMQCPHCRELFPKNDFYAYYCSGMDDRGCFDPDRADRSLLFNTEHPDKDDPLHLFGVDDGSGYTDGEHRWWFVGAYLVYGQWKQVVLAAVTALSDAYVLTDEPVYAHKTLVILDRIADLYPGFDFLTQGVLYEGHHTGTGYVTNWHDACEETRWLAMAYDKVFPALHGDEVLVNFLSAKAAALGLENTKQSTADIQRNIENGLLRDPLMQQEKIRSNYPRREYTLAVLETVLGWPQSRETVYAILDAVLVKGTAVDGLTGEKGLTGYSAGVTASIIDLLTVFVRLDPAFIADMYARYPRLHDLARFHIDTWCCEQYYPFSGDAGYFASRTDSHALYWHKGLSVSQPSYRLFWELYTLTGDVDLVKVLYRENGYTKDGLPHDLFAPDPESIQSAVKAVIAEHGATLSLPSVNKQEWGLAMLRSRQQPGFCLWLDYDSGGPHGHRDLMNLGFFALGLDMMPDNGYPPVQYGGWNSERSRWYMETAAHNTVVVNGQSTPGGHPPFLGRTDLWAAGTMLQAITASAPDFGMVTRYERTALLMDVPGGACAVDVFRVSGGTEHIRYLQSHFGAVDTQGLHLEPGDGPVASAFMRNFQNAMKSAPGWQVDWKIEDRYGYLDDVQDLHFRLTYFTTGADVHLCEGWIVAGSFDNTSEAWIPRVLTRRSAETGPLESTFVALLEPYGEQPVIRHVQRLPLMNENGAPVSDSHVALSFTRTDGGHDLLVLRDPLDKSTGTFHQPDWQVVTDAKLLLVRATEVRTTAAIAISGGHATHVGPVHLEFRDIMDYVEMEMEDNRPVVVHSTGNGIDETAIQAE